MPAHQRLGEDAMGRADAATCQAWRRRWLREAIVCALLLFVVSGRAPAAQDLGLPDMPQRIRVHGPALRAAVALGIQRSATFRRLHAIIDASDGIVYVIDGRCRHSVHACLVLSVTVTG